MKRIPIPTWRFLAAVFLAIIIAPFFLFAETAQARTITAKVVALDQPFFYNRLGAVNPAGMIYALKRDVVDAAGVPLTEPLANPAPGQVSLRPDKRPRPIVLRMNVGDVLAVEFTNLLDPNRANDNQPATRTAGFHVIGLQLSGGKKSDASNVGINGSSLASPGDTVTYKFLAQREGTFLAYSYGAIGGGEGNLGSLPFGLFGAVNVEPVNSVWYRSQVSRQELDLATRKKADGVTPRTTADGHPIIDYSAKYPNGTPQDPDKFVREGKAGLPILKIMDGFEIVHSDINAIVAGLAANNFKLPPGTYNEVHVNAPYLGGPAASDEYRSRNDPYREFTVIFHDEIFALQAFAEFADPVLSHTLHGVRDGFAINYGTGGIGSEILANRKGVGPMGDCVECKFEEFFLESWVVGDPAMIVDVPANTGGAGAGPQATMAMYPDDPSNVHHSYIGDHVKMRNVHAGKEHHVFHLHAHQWLETPDDPNSVYLDSQRIGPGSSVSYEITYNGSGNRNQTVGDAIFHCHFYPHFAMGMWELWRNHDTFEYGTVLADDPTLPPGHGLPAPGARALPDGEIAAGTPIPAVVPIPGRPMAPMPGNATVVAGSTLTPPLPGSQIQINEPTVTAPDPTDPAQNVELYERNPGYPFFMPAYAGHRAPQPPLDMEFDGGLPRHIIVGGTTAVNDVNRLSFDKVIGTAEAVEIPQDGTMAEKTAMAFHSQRFHNTFDTRNNPAQFRTNGQPPVAGAPYAEPCINDSGQLMTGSMREYRVAAIQLDMIMNKVGWHFPQSRILALWGDVFDLVDGIKPPEPLFFRANSDDCIVYHHANLIPNIYELDDFQVRTPTDIIGQHIHLVKFDVTSSDGSGNGFNYEDGTFSPQEVHERIDAINAVGGTWTPVNAGDPAPAIQQHPAFPGELGLGAQTTIQRWFADDVLNNGGTDRTLRTVFTHDHFGPSTHQQAGLYASLVMEPKGSTWQDPESDTVYGSRFDGGPTSWRADIVTSNPADSYREFLLQFGDFMQAYEFGTGGGPYGGGGPPGPDPDGVIQPPIVEFAGLPFLLEKEDICPGGATPPCPEAIMANDPGTMVVNYRNEPLALRVLDPSLADADHPNGRQAVGTAGDLASAYRSDVTRAIADLNFPNGIAPYPPLTNDVLPGDPFTPMMRVYDGDKVQFRVQVGSTEESHNITVHGLHWLQDPSSPNSGYRNAQSMGISEHFEFMAPILPVKSGGVVYADRLYTPNSSIDGQWHGVWGLLRSYSFLQTGNDRLDPLTSNNQIQANVTVASRLVMPEPFNGVCPVTAPLRTFDITAVAAENASRDGTLVYNTRDTLIPGSPYPRYSDRSSPHFGTGTGAAA